MLEPLVEILTELVSAVLENAPVRWLVAFALLGIGVGLVCLWAEIALG